MGGYDVRFNNYFMAAGRIGVALILVPLVWLMAFLLIFGEGTREFIGFGVFLFALGMMIAWMMFRTPLWVALAGDRFLVRYLLGTKSFAVNDIDCIKSGVAISTIGPGSRRYPTMTFILKNGKKIKVMNDNHIITAIQSKSRHVRVIRS